MASVQLAVYDLTRGMASAFSPMLLGKQIEGVWHTGLVVHGTEWFFGYGVSKMRAGTTPFGSPTRLVDLGVTEVPPGLVEELVADLQQRFRPEDYNLIWNNCNHFTNELSQLLVGEGIPEYILGQAADILQSPMGPMLEPIILQMEGITSRVTANGFAPAPEAAAAAGQAFAASASAHAAAGVGDHAGSGNPGSVGGGVVGQHAGQAGAQPVPQEGSPSMASPGVALNGSEPAPAAVPGGQHGSLERM